MAYIRVIITLITTKRFVGYVIDCIFTIEGYLNTHTPNSFGILSRLKKCNYLLKIFMFREELRNAFLLT